MREPMTRVEIRRAYGPATSIGYPRFSRRKLFGRVAFVCVMQS